MKNRFNKFVIVVPFIICFMIFGLIDNFSSASSKEVTSFVNNLTSKVMEIFQDKSLKDEQKEKKLEVIFRDSMDLYWIARFSLGRYWEQIDQKQKDQYLQSFDDYMIKSYVPNFKSYTNKKINILDVSEVRINEYAVKTELAANEDPTNKMLVVFRVTKSGPGSNDYKIFDIVAENVSLLATQRSEFASIISESGFNSLITSLAKK